MGFIVADNDKGIHGEARRESFAIYDDFGSGFHVELEWDKLDELAFVVRKLQDHRDSRPTLGGER